MSRQKNDFYNRAMKKCLKDINTKIYCNGIKENLLLQSDLIEL